jgi:hypothetical protein
MSTGFNFVTLPLTTKRGGQIVVPQRSGLNWGQRPGRDPNQAYLSVPVEIQRSGFFPDRGEVFIVECDDGFAIKCVRAQANGKGIESPTDNSIIGNYFRKRLGVRSGHMVTIEHLHTYGRTSVDVHYRNEHLYYLDFSTLAGQRASGE